jgi:RNA polymerase sigma-70 factor (ECF subfamily)
VTGSSFGPVDELTRLAVAARSGDAAALESFIKASYDQVWRFCASLTEPTAADDLTQETFTRCVRSLRRFRGDASALTWLLSIARHVCANELRSRTKTRRNALTAYAEDLSGKTSPDASGEVAVADLLARLDQDRRAAFVLTQVLGLPYAEAATVCGCPVGTIRSRVARAREDLMAMLAVSDPGPQYRRQAGTGPS